MSKRIDMTGKRFGRLLVISYSHTVKSRRAHWNVLCDCGTEKTVSGKCLRSGYTRSCGCLQKESARATGKSMAGKLHPDWAKHDLTGKEFGRLVAIKRLDKQEGSVVKYLCKCACGNFKEIAAKSLVGGCTKSCGCLQKEAASKTCKARIGELHPNWNQNRTDEERSVARMYPEYYEWRTSVFERDNYTCQKCGKKGEELRAHHIYGYANNEEMRLDLSNGVTLCKKHHDELHDLYGYDVGRENLNKFIK